VNNALVFPGLFKGVLERRVRTVTEGTQIAVAEALAAVIARPTSRKILPTLFDRRVVKAVAGAVR
jgi:malate dehydrogenase (oxaloacetate-decarboxylating)